MFERADGLKKSADSMKSSPSAYFLLVLNTHRLVYFAETAHAPDIKSFEATLANFIKRVRDIKLEERYRRERAQVTRKEVYDQLPRPSIKVVPLSERDRITDYLARFSSIQSVRLRLIRPNHELDASQVVGAVRERFGPLLPDRLDIVASRSDGMIVGEVAEAVKEATETGSTSVTLKGKDADGATLSGSNDQFALTTDLLKPAKTDEGLRQQLYTLYTGMLAAGKIKLGVGLQATGDKITRLMSLL